MRQQLANLLAQAQAAGKRVVVVIWDNASWHTAKALRRWYYRYNQTAKRDGRVRLLLVSLPGRSPWLNPLEPIFGQAKRHIVGRRPVPQPGRLTRKTEGYFERREQRLARHALHAAASP